MTSESPTLGYRLRHTMLRVRDLDRSVVFYTERLGMHELRRFDVPATRRTLVFLGYGPEDAQAALELGHEWDRDTPYETGDGFGHIAIGVPDMEAAMGRLRGAGVTVLEEPRRTRVGGALLAFVADPDGYVIELIEESGAGA